MRLPGYIGISRAAPIAVLFILCLVAFLYPYQLMQLTTGMFTPAASTTEYSSHAGVAKPEGGHYAAGNYPSAALEESETGNQLPVNAEYLTALLLVVFFGVLLSVLGGRHSWHRQRALRLTKRPMPPVNGSYPCGLSSSLLSVFIL